MANHVLIQKIELSQSTASITFANIPQTGYTDLKIVYSAKTTDANYQGIYVYFNGSNANLTSRYLLGSGAAASSGSFANGYAGSVGGTGITANTFSNSEIYIPNYTSANYKSFSNDNSAENNATTAYINLVADLWSSTAAITSVTIVSVSPFIQYSTFSLYGLAAYGTSPSSGPLASGGNTITTDGTYWYHAFLTSGTFTPIATLSCDVLVVAGGGSAGSNQRGGGGGAGGLLAFTSQSLTATATTVTVGAGGAATANSTTAGNDGSDSQFGALTLVKGGGGGSGGGANTARAGGSGGGASYYNYSGGSPTTSQGFAGGNSTNSYPTSAGGGGAGAVGGNTQSSTIGGIGGVGATSAMMNAMGTATSTGELSGGNYYYAGGGGGGSDGTATVNAGGLGGGGDGRTPPGEAGTANTGGGGGGGSYISPSFGAGGAGGSGIVIVRYAV
jgi:hypothetical protein